MSGFFQSKNNIDYHAYIFFSFDYFLCYLFASPLITLEIEGGGGGGDSTTLSTS